MSKKKQVEWTHANCYEAGHFVEGWFFDEQALKSEM